MCGIVGYIGREDCAPILVGGLKRLEYQGYDSAGIAVLSPNGLGIVRSRGMLPSIESHITKEPPGGTVGIGHTRWAPNDDADDTTAHPPFIDGVAVVHNGIIENHLELRESLQKQGHTFASTTDGELFARLIAHELKNGENDLLAATRNVLSRVRGTYALAVLSESCPNELVAARNASPLVVGVGGSGVYLASDVPALIDHTRDVIFLEEGDIARLRSDGIEVFSDTGQPVERPAEHIDWTPILAEKGGHKHYMHKEIHEQPRALADTLRGRILMETGNVRLEGSGIDRDIAQRLSKITILGCGTSYHAALAGKHYIESLARIPVEVDLSSEFRYRDPLLPQHSLVVAVSQSGETADTLGAMREARELGARTLAICNVAGSTIPNEADGVIHTHAGPEIGVASTKCFTTQLAVFYLLAVHLGRLRGTVDQERGRELLDALRSAPALMEQALRREQEIAATAHTYASARDVFFLGRHLQAPVALEGALKLKEISYIHAEGYPAGELKHGPVALIDENVPVVVLATRDRSGPEDLYERMLATMEEVRSRGGKVIAVVNEDDDRAAKLADRALRVPVAHPLVAPMINALPLQLLAYHVADFRGTDVDQPRNLTKAVIEE